MPKHCPRARPDPIYYQNRDHADLKAECEHRGLAFGGEKHELILRLVEADELAETPEGKHAEYQRQLEVQKKRKLADVIVFPYFSNLPTELRLRIWDLSLPGPRAICPGISRKDGSEFDLDHLGTELEIFQDEFRSDMLFFPKDQQSANPPQLQVCRESRLVALEKYHLGFGTNNIYVDWEVDILYFGPNFYGSDWGCFWYWMETNGERKRPRPEVIKDLDQVQRIGLDFHDGWSDYVEELRSGDDMTIKSGGECLRNDVSKFKSVKEVLLSDGTVGSDDGWTLPEPGYITIEDFTGWKYHDPDDQGDYGSDDDEWPKSRWSSIQQQFTSEGLSEEEKLCIPKLKLCKVRKVRNVPRYIPTTKSTRDW